MSLNLNRSEHWEIPGGAELHIGDQVEIYLEGKWLAGRIGFRPAIKYVVILNDGREIRMSDQLEIRVCSFTGVS